MACYSPLHGYKGPVNENGKRPIVFRRPQGEGADERQEVPCGKCIGCRLKYAKDWAVRCMHEAATHQENCFITLTFDDVHLPDDLSLDVRHPQLFMKRLRQFRARRGLLSPMKYFFAGEYGGKLGRPHYHALLFGHDFADKRLKVERFGNRIYESSNLSDLWPFGFHSIGDVNFASASYVARYCTKKVTGKEADEHYVDRATGVLRKPEFTIMSRRPGIGASWFAKFKEDVYPADEVIVNARSTKPPRYYDNLLDKISPDDLELIKSKRTPTNWRDNTADRLRVKEEVVLAKMKNLVRPLEA